MSGTAKLKHPLAKELRKAALAFPETVEDFPWGHSAFKVAAKKAFLFMGDDEEGGGWSASMNRTRGSRARVRTWVSVNSAANPWMAEVLCSIASSSLY